MYRVGTDVKNIARREETLVWKPSPVTVVLLGIGVTLFNGWAFAVYLTGF